MTKADKARMDMYFRLEEFLGLNSAKYTQIMLFDAAVALLIENNVTIRKYVQESGAVPDETAIPKTEARSEVAQLAAQNSCALALYAAFNNLEELKYKMKTSVSYLENQMPEDDFIVYCKDLIKSISEIPLTDIDVVGITEESTAKLATKVNNYEKLYTSARSRIKERKAANELLEAAIKNGRKIIDEMIDPAMRLFKDDAEFYIGYKAASRIDQPKYNKTDKPAEESAGA